MSNVISLPPIRKLLRPDPGYILIDSDYDRADAQAVAWEADEPELKAIFQQGLDIHTSNAQWLYQSNIIKPEQRQSAKNVIHAVDYGAKARTVAMTAGITINHAEAFIEQWFKRFPGVPRWHRRIEQQLRLSRQIHNVWGFRRFYFDRVDNLLPQALAWLGQSTVAITINKALLRVHNELSSVQLLLQVHDSLVMQAPAHLCPAIFNDIRECMRIEVPYKDPLIIPCSIKYSDRSWGDMTSWKEAA